MDNKKALSIISVLTAAFLLIAEVLTFAIVWQLDMLPGKYLALLAGLLFLLWLPVALLLFLPGRKKKTVGNVRRIIAFFLAVLVILGCVLISKMASELHQTVSNVSGNHGITKMVMVYVRADDPAKQIEDAKDYSFAYAGSGPDSKDELEQALSSLQSQLGQPLTVEEYSGMTQLVDALYTGEVDAIIMNSAYVGMLEEQEAYADFSDKTRVLHEISVSVTEPIKNPTSNGGDDETDRPVINENQGGQTGGNTAQTADITNTPFVVYISGSDTREAMLTVSRSDVNILVVVNPVTKQVLLLNTPRDYFIPHPYSEYGERDKLTHLGNSGVNCSIEGLTALYGERIDFYAQINFTGFEALIDAIGGVTVYSDVSFVARDTYVEVGENFLNGAQALDFSRERYQLVGGDNTRGKNQMKVIKAVIQKLASGAIITNYSSILDSLEGMFVTNMSQANISKLVKMQLSDMASWNVQSYAVTGETGSEETYSMPGTYLSVMYPDEGMAEYGAQLIDRVLSGETLTEADVVYPG